MLEHEVITDDYELTVYYTIEDNSFSHAFGIEHRKNELEIHGEKLTRNDTGSPDNTILNNWLDWKQIKSDIMKNYLNKT